MAGLEAPIGGDVLKAPPTEGPCPGRCCGLEVLFPMWYIAPLSSKQKVNAGPGASRSAALDGCGGIVPSKLEEAHGSTDATAEDLGQVQESAAGVVTKDASAAPRTSWREALLGGAAPGLVCGFVDYFGLSSALPTLPFYVDDVLGEENPAQAAATAFTLQYCGVLVGNLLWGRAAHRLGLRWALLLTLGGDAAFFTASGLAPSQTALCALRVCAGLSSPLVPALLQMFAVADRAVVFPKYIVAVVSGYFAGSACGGAVGETLGFAGACGIAGLLALAGCLAMAAAPASAFPELAPAPPAVGAAGEGAKAASAPARRCRELGALASMPFLTHSFAFVAIGAQWNGLVVLAALVMKERFGWTPSAVSTMFVAVAFGSCLGNLWLLPALLRRRGSVRVVRDGCAIFAVTAALLALPQIRGQWWSFFIAFVASQMTGPFVQGANQIRVPGIAEAHGGGALNGALMGWSRCMGNAGQMLGPALFTACMQVADWLPWVVVAVWGLAVAIVHALPDRFLVPASAV